jgi:hypothetical protein
MAFTSVRAGRSGPRFPKLGLLAVAVAAALCWLAWLGWDHDYQVDPATGVTSGPYQTWQVIGCAATLLALLVAAVWAGLNPWLASVALTVSFTVCWTVQAARADDTGMYGVGTVLLLAGLGAGSVAVAAVTRALRRRARGRSD